MATLGPFTHILVPAGKATKLYFAEDASPFFETADFARPDIDATSGATVFRDGVLVELAENEPDWSEPIGGGCPRLLMRPQAERVASIDLTTGWAQNALASNVFSENIYGSYPIYRIEPNISNAAHSVSRAFFDDPAAGSKNYLFEVYLKTDGYTSASLSVGTGSGNTVNGLTSVAMDITDIAAGSYSGTISASDVLVNELQSNGYRRFLLRIVHAGSANAILAFQIFPNTRSTYIGNGSAILAGTQIQLTNGALSPILASPTAASYTRSANSFTFTDLITKGAIGAGGVFSFIMKTIWQDTGADIDVLKFQTTASTDQITLRAKTGGNLVIAYEDGGLTELGTGLAVDTLAKLGFSYNGSSLIFSVNGSTSGTATVTLGTITKVTCPAANRYFEIASDVYAGFSPMPLAAADLNNETTA